MKTLTTQQTEQVHGAGSIISAVTRQFPFGLATGDFLTPHPVWVDY